MLGTIEVERGKVKFIASVYATNQDKYGNETARANAARIVSCVNALEGVEDPKKWREIQIERIKENVELLQQRDELLKALESVVKVGKGTAPSVGYMEELIIKAENAIAKAIGGNHE